MKHVTITLMLAFASIMSYAQSTNPLNYSGRMYVEAVEIIATPRYVSYEDHAILSQQMRIPSVEITKIDMDFEKGIVTAKEIEMKIKVNGCKKYDTDRAFLETYADYIPVDRLKDSTLWYALVGEREKELNRALLMEA